MIINEIRTQLLDEAKSSPNLLSDLAGLESYISESYNNRSFIELLQNADDANSTKFKILKNNNFLYVANNGRDFTSRDVESICRSASSNKTRGETIGYRGIGFKSVVGFSKEIHIVSGDIEITFSKERTHNEIPNATKVPLIRIPHQLNEKDKSLISVNVEQLKREGFSTIFVFSGVTTLEIENEYESFDYKSLLFLRNISCTEILISENNLITNINKEIISENEVKLTIKNNEDVTEWLVSNFKNTSVAFKMDNCLVTKISLSDSYVYSFLPTENVTGLGVLVNGDFSTDPSRKHLIYDNETISTIQDISSQIVNILIENICKSNDQSVSIINGLIPYSDPRLISFKKTSFEKLLLEHIKKSNPDFFDRLFLPPIWINSKDYNTIIKSNYDLILDTKFLDIDGFIPFLKYLGVKEDAFESIKEKINDSDISILGCSQIFKYIFSSLLSNDNENFISSVKDLKIVLTNNNKRISFNEMNSDNIIIEESFISLLLENGLTEFDIKQGFKKILPNYNSNLFIDKQVLDNNIPKNILSPKDNWYNSNQISGEKIKYGIRKWRTSEEITLEILNLNGFDLKDVSKQNIGYDLDGYDPDGKEIHIEVKSITLPGQKFKLTNNEIGVAQEKPNSFYVAVVRQTDDYFEIAMISNPIKNLNLNRQCVQWIWECSEYEYNPKRFEI